MTRRQYYVALAVLVVCALVVGCSEPDPVYEVALELRTDDEIHHYGDHGTAPYQERLEKLMELTGSSAQEISDRTHEGSARLVMSHLTYMSAAYIYGDDRGPWKDFDELADAYEALALSAGP
jgi:hypothetical protein